MARARDRGVDAAGAVVTQLLAIDPGSAGEGNACAFFQSWGGRVALSSVWFERLATPFVGRPHVETIVVERPAYQGLRSDQARVQDLLNLAWSGALLAGAYAGRDGAELVEYTPAQWKGSEQKPIQHYRLWQVLEPAERAVLGGAATERRILAAREKGALKRWPAGGKWYGTWTGHNLLDAVALGCHHLGRLERK